MASGLNTSPSKCQVALMDEDGKQPTRIGRRSKKHAPLGRRMVRKQAAFQVKGARRMRGQDSAAVVAFGAREL